MSIDVEHKCDGGGCRQSADYCYCQDHYNDEINDAYEKGRLAGVREASAE